MAKKVLVVLTSVDVIPKINKPTGWYLPEFAHPYNVLAPKTEIVVASPMGGIAPLDPASVEMFKTDAESTRFLEQHQTVWQKTRPLYEFVGRSVEFAAIFFPGGHGPMFDIVDNRDSIRIIEEFYRAGKPIAAVCHGPAAFVRVKVHGRSILEGRRVTAFTNVEEEQVKLADAMPFSLEDELKKTGALFQQASEPWGAMVQVDGQFITGQNPASAKGVGEAIAMFIGVNGGQSHTGI